MYSKDNSNDIDEDVKKSRLLFMCELNVTSAEIQYIGWIFPFELPQFAVVFTNYSLLSLRTSYIFSSGQRGLYLAEIR